jgi:chromosome partitioning protein
MTKILTVVNQKGGVGKTTTTVNLATSLAAIDKKVLIIDLDPQGNATTGMGIEKNSFEATIYDILIKETDINEVILGTEIERLDIIPSNIELSAAEMELNDIDSRHFTLSKRLQNLKTEYDVVLIDCPPSLGLLTVNALICASSLIIPLQCEFYALEGLSHLLKTFQIIRDNFNANLYIEGIILTMYDKRNKLTEQIEEDVRGFLGDRVFETVIPRNVKLSEAPSHGQPAILYDINCPGSVAYLELAREMIRKKSFERDDSEGDIMDVSIKNKQKAVA